MSDDASQVPKLLGFGLLCLGAAALLAWYSSVTTLDLARTEATATLAYETRLFNLLVIDRQAFADVTSVSVIRSRLPGVRSNTPDYLMFQARGGQIDAGYVQQHFWRDYAELDAFFTTTEWPPPQALRLSSIDRGAELRRFVFAQAAVAFLALLGLAVWWRAVDTLMARRRADGR
jgi:hypothetical protein